jgi:hypothetical protein
LGRVADEDFFDFSSSGAKIFGHPGSDLNRGYFPSLIRRLPRIRRTPVSFCFAFAGLRQDFRFHLEAEISEAAGCLRTHEFLERSFCSRLRLFISTKERARTCDAAWLMPCKAAVFLSGVQALADTTALRVDRGQFGIGEVLPISDAAFLFDFGKLISKEEADTSK